MNKKPVKIKENLLSGQVEEIANNNRGLGGDKIIIDTNKNEHLEKYSEYSVHAFIKDRFDIYQPNKDIIPQNINLSVKNKYIVNTKKQEEPFTLSSEQLPNLATKYYKIDSQENTVDSTLYIRINTPGGECSNYIKASTILYGNTSDKPENYKAIKKLNLGLNPILGFKSKYSHIVLSVSNASGGYKFVPGSLTSISDYPICEYNLTIGIQCPINPQQAQSGSGLNIACVGG